MRVSQAGFSLLEVLLAAALFVVVAFGALEAVRGLIAGGAHLAARHLAYANLERLSAQLRGEARSSTAIWNGAVAAAGHDDCDELDFFTADTRGPSFWAYRRFPNHAASDTPPGDAIVRVAAAAPFAPCTGAGTVALGGVRVFTPWSSAPAFGGTGAAQLAAHVDPYTGQPDSPFIAPTVPQTPSFDLGVYAADGTTHVKGGNTLVELRVETDDAARVVDLVAGTVPSGYTEVLQYTCDARCGVGHAGGVPQTLTTCAVTWRLGWRYDDQVYPPAGAPVLTPATLGYFYAGWFTFTYSDDKYGQPDRLVKTLVASNYDPARDYRADPPVVAALPGDLTAQSAPDAASDAWYANFAPYIAAAYAAPLAREFQTCTALRASTAQSYVQNV